MYDVTVWNEQGASEYYSAATQSDANHWLSATWSDPEALEVRVRKDGRDVGHKDPGAKRIKWARAAAR